MERYNDEIQLKEILIKLSEYKKEIWKKKGKIVLFSITFSFIFHFLNGIRHIVWDFGFGFNIKNVYLTGFIIILLTLAINIYIWFF